MPETLGELTNEEFEMLCLKRLYHRLAESPARFNLAPIHLDQTAAGSPQFTCPACNTTAPADDPNYLLSCPVCNASLLIVDTTATNNKAKRPRKKR